MTRSPHLALYGNVAIRREWCAACEQFALVVKGKLACCDRRPDDAPIRKLQRFSEPEEKRRISAEMKARILAAQEFRCMYCQEELNGRMHFDHLIPFAYAQNNAEENYVAACPWCNLHKRDLIFPSIDAAQQYLSERKRR